MKKGILLITMFALMLSLGACATDVSPDNGIVNNAATTPSQDGQNVVPTDSDQKPTPLEVLEASAQKLKEAKSLKISICETQQDSNTIKNDEWCTVLFSTNTDGAYTWLLSETGMDISTGNPTGYFYYINGNVGYEWDTYYDQANTLHTELWRKTGFRISYGKDFLFAPLTNASYLFSSEDMFENFCSLNPEVTVDETGITHYRVKDLKSNQIKSVFPKFEPTDYVYNQLRYDICFTVDAAGYLQSQSFITKDTYDQTACTITYSQVNEEIEIKAPDLTQMAEAEEMIYLDYFSKDSAAKYTFSPTNALVNKGVPSYCFIKILGKSPDTYQLLSKVDGLPVYLEGGLADGGNPDVILPKNLIVPAGIKVYYQPYIQDVNMFYEDTRATIYKNLPYSLTDIDSVHFAGEWSMVNGIPTPNN